MTSAIGSEADVALAAALAHPATADALALVGPAGTGKTHALVRRASALAAELPRGAVLLSSPNRSALERLRDAGERADGAVEAHAIADIAREILGVRTVDDVAAATLFGDACASLFALEWPELAAAHIDPEITGLRSPQRFAAAAFRLIGKLRASLVSPAEFKATGLRRATEFYGRPPNLAGADLLSDTADKYRSSLRVSPAELDRQRAREVDLVLILARLYELYVATLRDLGLATANDAVYDATFSLRARPDLRDGLRHRFPCAAIDDAQDLTGAQLAFLKEIYGSRLAGVTLAGDAAQATRGFSSGGRGAAAFKDATTTIAFEVRRRSNAAIERIALAGLDPRADDTNTERQPRGERDAVTFYRAENDRDEARFIVAGIERLLASGTPAAEIAVVTRHLHCAHAYIDALLARDVPVDVGGVVDLYVFPAVLDAIAALWAALDPFRHDYLLRNLEAPWMRLSDASIAVLCGEARDPQPLLFELPEGDEDDEASPARWDRKRNLRLGRNVTRGDVDDQLSPDARERVETFRAARERWQMWSRTLGPSALARAILSESALATLPSGARGRFDAGLIARFVARIDAFEEREPLATLEDFLRALDRDREIETAPPEIRCLDTHAVRVLDVEAAKGATFEAVFVPDLRAGAWPRYYVPDAFLYMPKAGMIAKENVGEATAARTAKFTYSLFRYKFREQYNDEERRAFYCAATRARSQLFLCASGRSTRGLNTPELLTELEKRDARLWGRE